jgi:hypothetical protein
MDTLSDIDTFSDAIDPSFLHAFLDPESYKHAFNYVYADEHT